MQWTASQNHASVDRVLTSQPQQMQQIIFTLTDLEKKNLFRYVASETTRYNYNRWEWMQLAIGLALVAGIVMAQEPKQFLVISGLMILTVLTCHFLLTPQLTGLGRMLDFVPLDQALAERKRFDSLGLLYTIIDYVKMGVGFGMLVQLLRRTDREKRKRRSINLEEIEYPNYGNDR